MAAVAGSVADEIMAALLAGRAIDNAYVNNGGDIALHLAPGEELNIAVAGTGHGFSDRVVVRADDPVRGIATSGWRGRSFSLGIADAVTVLARNRALRLTLPRRSSPTPLTCPAIRGLTPPGE